MKSKLVSEFKNDCVHLLNEVAQSGEELLVTKRGIPLVRVLPAAPAGMHFRKPGDCVGSVTIKGDIVNFDSTGDWEALAD
ncbi:MAG: type II toxin-antitoxin system Phd/YefM family antitoxin [Puniceicoccaceae bacterium]